MQVVGGHNPDGVKVLLFLQQFAEIRVGGDALEVLRCTLLRVIGLDDLFRHVPAATDAVDSGSPIGVLQYLAHAVADVVLVPVDVVRAVLDGVAYGGNLYVGSGNHSQ
jgi:hypothetical protein